MTTPEKNPWIAHARPNPRARLSLFCFPYAGGSAAVYRGWGESLPPEVEVLPVELPGRASRFREAPFTELLELVEALAGALDKEMSTRPFAFFGHSMGGLISFELSRRLRRERRTGPVKLLVSGRRAPQVPDREEPYHNLPEDEFIEKLRTLNGTPEEVLQHPELMQMLIPVLRADFAVNETYEYQEEEPIAIPIAAFGGLGDEEVEREDLEAWSTQTTGVFRLRMFPGDHFYLEQQRAALLGAVSEDLAGVLQALGR